MLRVILILLRRQRCRLRDMGRCTGNRGRQVGRLGILGVWLDALCKGRGGVEGSDCGWGDAAERSGVVGGGCAAEGGAGGVPQDAGGCAGEHCGLELCLVCNLERTSVREEELGYWSCGMWIGEYIIGLGDTAFLVWMGSLGWVYLCGEWLVNK